MPDGQPGKVFLYASRGLKTIAILAGGSLTVASLMAVAGLATDNGWLRLLIAVVVSVGLPLLVADRLLPEDVQRGKGIVTDVLAVGWLGFALLFVGAAIPLTRPLLYDEAARLAGSDLTLASETLLWIAGPDPQEPAAGGEAGEGGDPAADQAGEHDAGAAEGEPENARDAGVTAEDAAAAGDGGPDSTAAKEEGRKERSEMKPQEIFEAWAPAVVTIQVRRSARGHRGGGTGFLIDEEGTLVTNQHVIGDATDVRVKLLGGAWAAKVELLVADEDADIAILRISPPPEADPAIIGDSERIKVGEAAIAIGNPLGLEHTLTDGLISARRVIRGRKLIQTSTPVSPGNSGGPLFNARGEVIGVTTAIYGAGIAQNLNLAVPINTVKGFLEDDYPDKKRIGGGGPDLGTW